MNTSSIIIDQISFSLNFLKEINKQSGDSFICSPISLILPLVILLFGSEGNTRNEIKNVISPDLSISQIYNYYSVINEKLKYEDSFITLKTFNKGYITSEYEIDAKYKDFIDTFFNGSIEQMPFSNISHSIEKINDMVSNSTNGNIQKIIEANEISYGMKFILISALYFKSDWHVKFVNTDTKITQFYVSQNESKEVLLMSLENKFNYFENDLFQMISLPYLGKNMKMIIILPRIRYTHDNFIEFVLSTNNFTTALNSMKKEFVKVMIPRFEIQSTIDGTSILKNLGVVDAFDESKANFNGISSNASLYINDVKQKTKIEVTESGTEAAAITSVRLSLYSGGDVNNGEVITFRADHAFSFYIIDDKFNIYFSGIYK
uniref:SERPIN domain-containing protein n=1 Tax=Strongyloides papillosus TaxID=174720 RepID=A0A0N5BVH5_STREA